MDFADKALVTDKVFFGKCKTNSQSSIEALLRSISSIYLFVRSEKSELMLDQTDDRKPVAEN